MNEDLTRSVWDDGPDDNEDRFASVTLPAPTGPASAPIIPSLDVVQGTFGGSDEYAPFDTARLNLPQDRVRVQLAPEKAGFILKHVNYIVQSSYRKTSVLRRYSDFVWLHEVLSARYPQRILPNLPPKKVSVRFGLADQVFLEKRRRGLSRFINFIANHASFRDDKELVAFLREQGELAVYRKQATISSADEADLHGAITDAEADSVPMNAETKIDKLKDLLPVLIEQYTAMADVMDTIYTRTQANADDFNQYNLLLSRLSTISDCTDNDCTSCPSISGSYPKLGNGILRVSKVLREDAEVSLGEMVERLRSYLELLEAARDMLYRRDRMLANLTIDTLRKRIQSNKAKLDEQVAKGGVQKEMDKLANSIDADTREMETQVRRQAFSRFAVWQEIRLLHFHKRDVVAMYAGLVHEQARYGNSLVEEWAALAPIVEALPAY